MSDNQKKQAFASALRSLSASQKSRSELAGKLSDKGYPGIMIKEVLDDLEEQGILDDRSYARDLTARFTAGKSSGLQRVKFELKRRGIPDKIVSEITGAWDEEDERFRAAELARDRWETWQRLEPRKRRKKIYDLLIRRGFPFDVTREAVDAVSSSEISSDVN